MSLPTYANYRESGFIWLGSVPDDWTFEPLKRDTYVKARVGWKGLTSDEFEAQSDAYLVTGTDFKGRFIDWKSCYQVSESRYLDDSFIQLRNGDLLVTKDGTIGKTSMVAGLDKPACLNSGIFLVRPGGRYSSEYLYWVLNSNVFSAFVSSQSSGSTIQHLYQKAFVDFTFAFPDRVTQASIADYLDAQTAKIDALIVKQEQLIETLAERRQAVISHAVSKGIDPNPLMKDSGQAWLGPIPSTWTATRLKAVSSVQTGLTLGKEVSHENGIELPYLRVANVQTSGVDLAEVKTVVVDRSDWHRYRLRAGDVLMTEGGDIDKLGRGCIWNGEIDPCVHQNHVFAVRCAGSISARFLVYLLDARVARSYFLLTAKKTTNLASTNSTTLGNLPLALPGESEQLAIVDHLDHETSKIDALSAKAREMIDLLKERRQALISAAVTGKIDVRGLA